MNRAGQKIANIFGRYGDRGTAAIEFAMVAWFMPILIGGVTEIGVAMYEVMQVNAAVEAGILYAAANAASLSTSCALTLVSGAVTGASVMPANFNALTATPAPSEFCGCPNGGSVTPLPAVCSPTDCSITYPNNCSGASLSHLVILPINFVSFAKPFTTTAVIRIQ